MTELADLKARILANPEARAEYDAQSPEFELALELIAARTRAGLTRSTIPLDALFRVARERFGIDADEISGA